MINKEAAARGVNPFDHGPAYTDIMKTEALKQALDHYGFDAAFGGARRDEEKSARQGAHFLVPLRAAPLGPEAPAPGALAPLQRAQEQGREHPRLPAQQLDRAGYLAVHPPRKNPDRAAVLRRRAPRGRARRHHWSWSMTTACASRTARPRACEKVRFRTLGCYPLTGARSSDAATLPEIIQEMLLTTHLRAPGPRDRPRPVGTQHGEEEAGGLFLMAHVSDLIATDIDAYLRQHEPRACCVSSPAAASTTANPR
jgi:sulfate adenylyltransferase subunit 2